MGWWESKRGGIIGDSAVDIMMDAIEEIEKEYHKELDRKYTTEELMSIFTTSTSSLTKQAIRRSKGKDEEKRNRKSFVEGITRHMR